MLDIGREPVPDDQADPDLAPASSIDGPLPGDFRDWKLIRGWAQNIANELTAEQTPRRA